MDQQKLFYNICSDLWSFSKTLTKSSSEMTDEDWAGAIHLRETLNLLQILFNDLVLSMEDAMYIGMDSVATVITNGKKIAGIVYLLLSDEARNAVDNADVILSKGRQIMSLLPGKEDTLSIHFFANVSCSLIDSTSRSLLGYL